MILVTQDCRIHVCYYQHYQPSLQILKCPLGAMNMLRTNQVPPDDDPPDLVRLCLDATVGVSYNGMIPFHWPQKSPELGTLQRNSPSLLRRASASSQHHRRRRPPLSILWTLQYLDHPKMTTRNKTNGIPEMTNV